MLELGLNNKVVIVTGGSDGLGRACVEKFASEGAQIVACARRERHLQDVTQSIASQNNTRIVPVAMDVSNPQDCIRAVNTAIEEFGRLDVLINNAGTSAASGFEAVSDEDWQSDIDLKLMGAVRMCRSAIPHLKKAGGGSIVNATIGAAKAAPAAALPTSVTRAAGLNLTKALANEYAADNIRVNTICIGLIKSAQWERRANETPIDDFYDEMAKKVPLGRMGEACEYADLVAFLCSGAATFITGAAINLDGGMCPVV